MVIINWQLFETLLALNLLRILVKHDCRSLLWKLSHSMSQHMLYQGECITTLCTTNKPLTTYILKCLLKSHLLPFNPRKNTINKWFIIHFNCKYLLYKSFMIFTKSHSVHTNGFLINTPSCISISVLRNEKNPKLLLH